jgi:hypothetical protein
MWDKVNAQWRPAAGSGEGSASAAATSSSLSRPALSEPHLDGVLRVTHKIWEKERERASDGQAAKTSRLQALSASPGEPGRRQERPPSKMDEARAGLLAEALSHRVFVRLRERLITDLLFAELDVPGDRERERNELPCHLSSAPIRREKRKSQAKGDELRSAWVALASVLGRALPLVDAEEPVSDDDVQEVAGLAALSLTADEIKRSQNRRLLTAVGGGVSRDGSTHRGTFSVKRSFNNSLGNRPWRGLEKEDGLGCRETRKVLLPNNSRVVAPSTLMPRSLEAEVHTALRRFIY